MTPYLPTTLSLHTIFSSLSHTHTHTHTLSFSLSPPPAARESDSIRTASEGLYLGLLDIQPATTATAIAFLLNDIQRQTTAVTCSIELTETTCGKKAILIMIN